jgi:hypothetical protein
MLWRYSLNFTGFIEAPADIAQARQALIDKIAIDPASIISRIEPAEPSAKNLVDLGKKVFGLK